MQLVTTLGVAGGSSSPLINHYFGIMILLVSRVLMALDHVDAPANRIDLIIASI